MKILPLASKREKEMPVNVKIRKGKTKIRKTTTLGVKRKPDIFGPKVFIRTDCCIMLVTQEVNIYCLHVNSQEALPIWQFSTYSGSVCIT